MNSVVVAADLYLRTRGQAFASLALDADNNKQVAWAGESFDSAANADRAAREFKAGAKTARYETYKDSGGNWRWRA